jgi:hypothetical protein
MQGRTSQEQTNGHVEATHGLAEVARGVSVTEPNKPS